MRYSYSNIEAKMYHLTRLLFTRLLFKVALGILLVNITTAPSWLSAQTIEEVTDDEIFDFNFESGIYSIDLNMDGVSDILSIGYISAGTATTQFDFSFLISRPDSFVSNSQKYHVVVPDEIDTNYFRTRANADCVLRSLYLVKLGSEPDDWKLVISERTNVSEGGYTESPVELRLLKIKEATTAGFPIFSYRQVANIISEDVYCNANEAFDVEWALAAEYFARTIDIDN